MSDRLPELRLFWLGPPFVELKGRPIKLEMRKVTALLTYLSLNEGEVTRESLAAMFWPENDQQHALGSLRRTLWSLSASIQSIRLNISRETVGLQNHEPIQVDVADFRQHRARVSLHHPCVQSAEENQILCSDCTALLEETIRLYRGDFLEGFNLKDCPQFDDWQFYQRDTLRSEYGQALQLLVRGYEAKQEWEKALQQARRWASLDRLNETAQRAIIRLYKKMGQRSAARRQYESLIHVLHEELGQVPEAETTELYEAIVAGEMQVKVQKEKPSPPAVPAIQEYEPLVKTKLFIPSLRVERISRPRLLQLLDTGCQRALTLISAPAGFGKTTLLADWSTHTPLPIAWFSIDEGDNAPAQFLSYLIAALDSVVSGLGEKFPRGFQSLQPTIQPSLAKIINHLITVTEPFVLILDDYQFIHSQDVHKALAFLLDKMPTCMHIIVATRTDPPTPLARLRARDQLSEIRMKDLRFTLEESTGFLNQAMSLNLSRKDISMLDARTEGWIAGLQMAAFAIRTIATAKPTGSFGMASDRQDVGRFIQGLSGSHRYILDYLGEEVLTHLPDVIQRFLLQTSILDNLSGPLCDAVTETKGTQLVLEQLERDNLFLVPLDNERCWYRYHQLFADLLRVRLMQTSPDLIETLNSRAAKWFEQNRLLPEAINCALKAKDYRHVARLVELGVPAVWTGGGQATLLSWINSIPRDLILEHPWLCIWQALLLMVSGQSQKVEPFLKVAKNHIQNNPSSPESIKIRGHIANIKANVALVTGDVSQAKSQAEAALKYLPDNDYVMRLRAHIVLGYIYYWTGDIDKAEESFQCGLRLAKEIGSPYWIVLVSSYLGRLWRIQGQLQKAESIYQEALDFANGKENVYQAISTVNINYADLLMDTDRLSEASYHVKFGLQNSLRWTNLVAISLGYLGMARLQLIEGDLEGAADALQKMEQSVKDSKIDSELQAMLTYYKVRLWLAQQDIERAAHWLQHTAFNIEDNLVVSTEIIQMARARVMIALSLFQEAEKLLGELERTAESGKRYGRLIEIFALEACVFQSQGKKEAAIASFKRCLALAEPEGNLRILLDEGEPMRRLIEEREQGTIL